MFVVELIYKAPLTEIDAAMKAHVAFLDRGYADGHFVVSGRKIPRDGGIILVAGMERTEVETLMRQDPFVAQGLAELRIVEFRASQRAKDIDQLLATEPSSPARRTRR